jgi:hypothetical protein
MILRQKVFRLLFWKEQFETVCFNSFILKRALKWAWSACLRAARNGRVNSQGV